MHALQQQLSHQHMQQLHEPPKHTTACLFSTWRSSAHHDNSFSRHPLASLPLFYRLSPLLGYIVSYVHHHYVQMIYVWRFSRDKANTALGTSCSLHGWSWSWQPCHAWFLPSVAGPSRRFVVIIYHFLRVDCWSLCVLTSRPSHYIMLKDGIHQMSKFSACPWSPVIHSQISRLQELAFTLRHSIRWTCTEVWWLCLVAAEMCRWECRQLV